MSQRQIADEFGSLGNGLAEAVYQGRMTGPATVPWGTPQVMGAKVEIDSP